MLPFSSLEVQHEFSTYLVHFCHSYLAVEEAAVLLFTVVFLISI